MNIAAVGTAAGLRTWASASSLASWSRRLTSSNLHASDSSLLNCRCSSFAASLLGTLHVCSQFVVRQGLWTGEAQQSSSSSSSHILTDLAPSATAPCTWLSAAAAASSAHNRSDGSSLAARSLRLMCDSTCSCLKASLMALRLMAPSAALTANTAGRHVNGKGHSAGKSGGSCWCRQHQVLAHTVRQEEDLPPPGPALTRVASGSAASTAARPPGLADFGFAAADIRVSVVYLFTWRGSCFYCHGQQGQQQNGLAE